MSVTPNLGLPYIDAAQAQKHVTHNEALRALDALVQLAVQDRDLTAPPSTPGEGQRWIVKTGATGAWAGRDNQMAAWQDGAWQFDAPGAGWLAYVIDEGILVAWDGAAWSEVSAGGEGGAPTELQNMSLLGVATTADATNPFSAKLNNVLWTAKTVAEGGDGTLRYKLSKENAAKTLSFLFQDNFSGRAEIGLVGDDDFHFKVSPDGTSWLESLKIDHTTGRVSFPSGGAREVLTANRTYYVRTDGSDSNNGLTNASGGAFLTIQKAFDIILGTLDLSGFNVTIQLADGTYTSGASVSSPQVGAGLITVQGNSATPGNVVISTTGGTCFFADGAGVKFAVRDMELRTTTSGNGLWANNFAVINFQNIRFGAIANWDCLAQLKGNIVATGNYAITGSKGQGHIACYTMGSWYGAGFTITLTGTPNFAWGFCLVSDLGMAVVGSNTYSGAATGTRYSATGNGVIDTYGAGATFLPGNAAGSVSSGGQYI